MKSAVADVAGRVPSLDRPVLVAIDGADGAGKTTFADAVGERLTWLPFVRVTIDDFHHPRARRHALGRTAVTVWERSFDLDALRRELLEPWVRGPGSAYAVAGTTSPRTPTSTSSPSMCRTAACCWSTESSASGRSWPISGTSSSGWRCPTRSGSPGWPSVTARWTTTPTPISSATRRAADLPRDLRPAVVGRRRRRQHRLVGADDRPQ